MFRNVLEVTGVSGEDVSEVVLGQVLAAGQGQNPARQVGGRTRSKPSWTCRRSDRVRT